MPRPCVVCSRPDRQSIEELIAGGASDYEVGRQFNVERVSVGRHRRRHIIQPMRDRLAILAKDSAARQERQELAAAAASNSPSVGDLIAATVSMKAQLTKLIGIERRLENMSALAEEARSATGVAVLTGQQIRALEFGAKLGGTGGFAAPRPVNQPADGATKFSIAIIFNGAGTREEITMIESRPPGEAPQDVADGVDDEP